MDAMNVHEGREPPRRERQKYADVTGMLAKEKVILSIFLDSNP